MLVCLALRCIKKCMDRTTHWPTMLNTIYTGLALCLFRDQPLVASTQPKKPRSAVSQPFVAGVDTLEAARSVIVLVW